MKIGFVGPIDTRLLAERVGIAEVLPHAYSIPMNSLLVASLLDKGHEVVVFGLSDEVDRLRYWEFGKLKIYLGRFRSSRRARDFFRVERDDLVAAMQAEPCDILNAHWTYEYALAALAIDKKSLISVRDWAPAILWQMPDMYRLIRLFMASSVYFRGKYFTVNSPYVGRLVRRWTRNQSELIANGLDDVAFMKLAKWKPLSEERTLIAINRGFFKRKNIPALLRAFKIARSEDPLLRLKLIGFESEYGGIGYRWAQEHDLIEGVEFLGHMTYSATQEHLSSASLLIHPSYEESFGMVLIEAMAKGIPVIAGEDSGAVPWVLDSGKAGVLVDVSNPEAIASSVKELMGNEAHWRKFSDSGYAQAWGKFRMSRIADRYIEQYGLILNRDGR